VIQTLPHTMIFALSNAIQKMSRNWVLVVFFFVATAYTLYRINTFAAMLNEKEMVFDLRVKGFSADEATAYLKMVGPKGADMIRRVYTEGYDVVYPIATCIFSSLVLSIVWKGPYSGLLNLLPFVVFTVDMVENMFIYRLVNDYEAQQLESFRQNVTIASQLVVVKFSIFFVEIALLLIGTLLRVFGGNSQQTKAASTHKKSS